MCKYSVENLYSFTVSQWPTTVYEDSKVNIYFEKKLDNILKFIQSFHLQKCFASIPICGKPFKNTTFTAVEKLFALPLTTHKGKHTLYLQGSLAAD